MIPNFKYLKANSIDHAVNALTEQNARVHSGGTDLLGCLRDGVFEASTVVSLSGVKNLAGVKKNVDGSVTIGAMTPVVDLVDNEEIKGAYPALHAAVKVIASPQIRNQGTIGGNICQRPRCWYFRGDFHCAKKGGDMCYAVEGENVYHAIFGGDPCHIVHPSDSAVAFVAHDAKVTIVGPDGERTIPMEEFFVLPEQDLYKENVLGQGEFVISVTLPKAGNLKGTYNKIRTRESWDFAIVSAGVVARFDSAGNVSGARIVLGGVAPKPWRVPKAEAALAGKKITMESAKAVAEVALEGANPLAQNAYKIAMTKGAIVDALLSLND